MKILNFGSMNLDHSYEVDHFVRPGETLAAQSVEISCGGKGLNQSVALARAGALVWHGGCVGRGGEPLLALLQASGVNTTCLRPVDVPQGHAVIQREAGGENGILLYGGSNRAVTPAQIEQTIARFEPGDWLLLQNEVNGLSALLAAGAARGLTIALNPSPCDAALAELDLSSVAWLILNKGEAEQLTGFAEPERVRAALHRRWPQMRVVLTLGAAGSVLLAPEGVWRQPAYPAQAVDTTGAGDTFTGYFLAGLLRGLPWARCLEMASCAAALSVMRPGAADSIPILQQVEAALERA